MKLKQLLAELSAAYANHGDIDVLLSIDIETHETTGHAEPSALTVEESHGEDEALFLRIFGADEA